MEITDIKIRKATAEGKLKAYVNVTFDDCFVVHNLKIIDGKDGAFIAIQSLQSSEQKCRKRSLKPTRKTIQQKQDQKKTNR